MNLSQPVELHLNTVYSNTVVALMLIISVVQRKSLKMTGTWEESAALSSVGGYIGIIMGSETQ